VSDEDRSEPIESLAAGALEVFTVDPSAITYKQAAGALEVFTVDPSAIAYKQAAGALEVFTARSW